MNLLNRLTIKNLKLNKKRTIVTIIGIVLSVALLTAVASMFWSSKASLIKFEKERNGNYHWEFQDVPVKNISDFEENRKIENISIVKNLGYDYLDGGKNEYKPYINVKAYNKSAMENLAINIVEGRLPENDYNKPTTSDNPPGMFMSDSGLYLPDSVKYNNEIDRSKTQNKPEDKLEDISEDNQEPKKDYIEDKIINSVGTKMGNAKKKLGRTPVIREIKNLPNKSKIIDKGVERTKKLTKTGARATRYYAQGMANKISNKVKSGQLGRKTLKLAGGVALGTIAATVAAGVGIASGDPSKAAQYVGTAAAGGYVAGSRSVDKTVDAFKVDGTKDVAKETYYGKNELKKIEQQKAYKQKQSDLQLRWKLEEKLGSKEAAKKYIKDDLPELVKYGDFDNKTIVAMAQMQENDKMSRDETIAAALMSEQYLSGKNSRALGDKAYSEFEKTIKRRGKERGLEGENLDKFNKKTQKAINKLDEYRFD